MYARRARIRKIIGIMVVLVSVLAIGAVSEWWGFARDDGSGGAGEDVRTYGPIFADAERYERDMLSQAWISNLPVQSTTFGKLLPKQYRLSLEGLGSASAQQVVLQTQTTARLFDDPKTADEAERFLRGLQDVLDDRNAQIEGLSFSPTLPGYAANWISIYIENGLIDKRFPKEYRTELAQAVEAEALLIARHTYAWYQFDSTWIVFGPQMTKTFERHVRNPAATKDRDGGELALVIAHEVEHAVSAVHRSDARTSWMEEGIADTLANWPGRVAQVAKQLGLPYRKRADALAFDQVQKLDGGYPVYVTSMRRLLRLAGVDTADPAAFSTASDILQNVEFDDVPTSLAEAIADRHILPAASVKPIAAAIEDVDGRPARVDQVEQLVRKYS